MSDRGDIDRRELQQRVVYSLFQPVTRLATEFGMRLKDLTEWCEMAYFHRLRKRGLKMREVSAALDVSMRKAALLAARLKTNFFDPERLAGLPRRIEFMLWAGPLGRARVKQVLTDEEPEAVDEAIDLLIEQGRVEERPGTTPRLVVTRREYRLVRDHWLARIDGLNHLAEALANAALARFFREDERAFARTLGFRVRPSDASALRQLYEETIYPTLKQLDEAAADDPAAVSLDFSILWAPTQAPDASNEGSPSGGKP